MTEQTDRTSVQIGQSATTVSTNLMQLTFIEHHVIVAQLHSYQVQMKHLKDSSCSTLFRSLNKFKKIHIIQSVLSATMKLN